MIKRRFVALACSAPILFGTTLPVRAAEWASTASVSPGIVYTDNVCLSSSNEQDEWIGIVTPAGSISGNGNRAHINLNGSVEFNTLSDSDLENFGCSGGQGFGNREQFAPRINGNAGATVVDQWFYIDGNVNAYQNDITPYASGGGDSLNTTGNTNTTYNYAVSPYIAHRFKDTAELNIRYTWDDQYNSADVLGDSAQQRAKASLGSVPGVSKFFWGLEGNYSETDFSDERVQETNNASELRSAQVNLGYQLDRYWQINGYYGNEWNDFVSSRDDIDGSYWDTGVQWTPNVRTTVAAGIGERFFGNTPRFSATHRHKRSTFSASYAKTLTYDRDIRSLDEFDPGDPGVPPPPEIDSGQSIVTNSPIVDQRFTLAFAFQGRRTSFGLRGYQSEQTRESIGGDSIFRGASFSASRSLSKMLSLNAGVYWNEQEPKDVGSGFFGNSETWSGSVGLTKNLTQKVGLGVNYRYTDRQSDNGIDEYTENRVTLNLTVDL